MCSARVGLAVVVLSIVGSVCSVLSLFVSLFVAYKVRDININKLKVTQSGTDNKSINQVAKGDSNTQIGTQ